jgi:hypothetical protein
MSDSLDLTGDIAEAINGAALRGSTLALAYVKDDGSPSVSLRGSIYVHDKETLGLWARSADSGLAAAVGANPRVSLVYYAAEGPGAKYVSVAGRARVAPEANDEVWDSIIEGERGQDPERKGVAILIDVDTVAGAAAAGFFQQTRA